MPIQFNITKKITVNGKEYGSLDELPPELRRLVEQGLKTAPRTDTAATLTVDTKIVFNGQEYPSVEAMPAETRRLYDAAMEAVRGVSPGSTFGLSLGLAPKATAHSQPTVRSPRLQLTIHSSDPGWLKAVKIGWGVLVAFALLYVLVRHLAAP